MSDISNVIVRRLDPKDDNLSLSAWVCYQKGFAEAPWNEWKTCDGCHASFGTCIGETLECPLCASPLKHFWPLETIAADILSILELPHACCHVAIAEGTVVGLVLGCSFSTFQLSDHLGVKIEGIPASANVAYQDEVVVHPEWQGKGIGRLLYNKWMEEAKLAGMTYAVARTLSDPPTVVYDWYRRIGYSLAAKYPEPDNRVVLSLDLSRTL